MTRPNQPRHDPSPARRRELLTKVQVEAELRMHRNTVTKMLRRGDFPNAFLSGGRWRIPASDLDEFMKRRRPPARPPAARA